MNPIVFALRRPVTVVVLVAAVALGGLFALTRLPVDIFPNLDLPVICVSQPYGGMDPAQMEGLLANYYEYHFLYISGIHHVESRNIQGLALMKLFFHPGTNMSQAMAETIGYVTRSRAFMPPGTVPPFVTRFDAGSIPAGCLVLSSESRSIGEIQDQALFKVRPMFASLPGVSAPPPFGGNQRTIVVRADPERLRSYAVSPDELVKALEAGNAISPSGAVRIGDDMPIASVNSLARSPSEIGEIPIRSARGNVVHISDVASVLDASDVPSGVALVNGKRAVYILVTKRPDASTLSVVQNVRAALPKMQAALPDDIRVSFELDQSPVVVAAARSLAVEAALGAGLIGLMTLVFLRDWRSVIVVVLNIPFAILAATLALWLTGQTLNLMTLGGLALAIGILVDESTVEIENIHHKMETVPSVASATRLGNQDTAVPRLLAMLCILAVFLPAFLMQGAARALFVPLALSVAFSMIASYLLSSTFVPVLCAWILEPATIRKTPPSSKAGLGALYFRVVSGLASHRLPVVLGYVAIAAAVPLAIFPRMGLEIFPKSDAGRFQLRMRAPAGSRFELTEKRALEALDEINRVVGDDGIAISIGYVGLIPSSYPINAIHQWTAGPEEALLRVALKNRSTNSLEEMKERLRIALADRLPDVRFSFEPADITSEVMSMGSPTPIEISVNGPSLEDDRAFAAKIKAELAKIPELRDIHFVQTFDYPTVDVRVNREKAGLAGVTAAEIARSLVAATSSSRFVTPNYWPDPKTGIGYQVQVEIPYQIMNSIHEVETIPVRNQGEGGILLRDVATVTKGKMPGELDRYNMKRLVTISANIHGADLGGVSREIDRALAKVGEPPRGATVEVRGQMAALDEILRSLYFGLGVSIIVIALVLTAYFQAPGLAITAISAAPATLVGVLSALWWTRSTINLQSFMGAIMAMGVATANAILLVTFAERLRRTGMSSAQAAAAAARGRLRPIVMTALAMIAGMTPMALGLGESGEQSAPLGRAVIGGLAASVVATLFILPAVFALVRSRAAVQSASLDPADPQSERYDPQTWNGAPPSLETAAEHPNSIEERFV